MTYESWYRLKAHQIPGNTEFSSAFAEAVKGKAVLDVGCGNGDKAERMRSLGASRVVCTDINHDAVRYTARFATPGIEAIVDDICRTNLAPGSFDLVNFQGVLACLLPDERHTAIRSARRLLRNNGMIHVSEFGRKEGWEDGYGKLLRMTGEYGTDIVYGREGEELFRSHNFTKEELEGLITQNGFKILSYETREFETVYRRYKIPGHMFMARKSK
jgi:SAM-dependent methyltransferase